MTLKNVWLAWIICTATLVVTMSLTTKPTGIGLAILVLVVAVLGIFALFLTAWTWAKALEQQG